LGKRVLIAVARVLDAAIRVMDQAGCDPPRADRQVQGREDELGLQRRAHRPPDDTARGEVEDHGEIDPPLGGPTGCDIRRPNAIRPRDLTLPGYPISHDVRGVTTVRGHAKSPPPVRVQPPEVHQSAHAALADANPLRAQRAMQPRTAVCLATLGVDHPEARREVTIGLRARRWRAIPPGVESAGADVERPTERADRVVGLLRSDERKAHSLYLAKKAVAFFRMSRSWRNCVTSRRNRRNSVRSSSVSGTAGSGRVAAIQLRNAVGVIAKSRAIAGMDSMEVRARRTASALNSGLYVGRRR
jgi:hypothetical protein